MKKNEEKTKQTQLTTNESIIKSEYNHNIYFKRTLAKEKKISNHLDSIYAEYQFILCINCESQVFIDEIEAHSLICHEVKEEVLRNNSSAMKNLTFKINKLTEYVSQMLDNGYRTAEEIEEIQEIKTILVENQSILQFKKDFNDINNTSITFTRKGLNTINMKISKIKENFYILILLERVRLLLNEKLKTITILITKTEKVLENSCVDNSNIVINDIFSQSFGNKGKKLEKNDFSEHSPSKKTQEQVNSIDSSLNQSSKNNFSLSSISSMSLSNNLNSSRSFNHTLENEVDKIVNDNEKVNNKPPEKKSQKLTHQGIWEMTVKDQIIPNNHIEFTKKKFSQKNRKKSKPNISLKRKDMTIINEEITESTIVRNTEQ